METDSTPKTEPEVGSGSGSPQHANETVSPDHDISAGPTAGRDNPPRRKRSAAGCVTCRKRKVQCDQGIPACQNCIKSRRQCEGYSYKITFPEPLGALALARYIIPAPRPLNPLPVADRIVYRSVRSASFEFDSSPATPIPDDWTPQSDDRTSAVGRGPRSTTKHPAKGMYHADSGQKNPMFGSEQPGQVEDDFAYDTDSMSLCDSGDEAAIPSPPQGLESFLLQGIKTLHPETPGTTLTTYRPSLTDSPFTNPETATIFWHFVMVTAPTISLYESTGMYNGRFSLMKPVPGIVPDAAPEVTVWAESFPVMSFQHPALMHAMLALASLQIAQLQKVPPKVALKHYHLALRRTTKNVQRTSKKHHPATVACLLLLAYFELWMGDLVKCSSHLTGLREVFNDTKSGDNAAVIGTTPVNSVTANVTAESDFRSHGSTENAILPSAEAFEQLREIYWAQLRMDVYQSLLAPTQAHLSDEYWQTKYPPRAPIGDLATIHGTSDHLTLLLRQVTGFASSEKDRKARLGDSTRPGEFGGGIPREEADARRVELLDAWIAAKAIYDWEDLLGQFELFKHALGPEYGALKFGPDVNDKATSPFGPPLRYEIHAVAGVWMNFHMGLIHLHLLNPSLPRNPAMAAASTSAKSTSASVDQIGQIIAGLAVEMDLPNTTRINGAQCAVLVESCVPVLVAGIQTVDRGRRDWLIKHLSDVERLTGCQLARYARDTCESLWANHATVGRGPSHGEPRDSTDPADESIRQSPRKPEEDLVNPMSAISTHLHQFHYGGGVRDVENNLERLDLVGASRPLDLLALESAAYFGQGHETGGDLERDRGGPSFKDANAAITGSESRTSRKRSAFTAQKREVTAVARKQGVCASCKRRRVRCHPRHLDGTWGETEMRKSTVFSPALPGGAALFIKTTPGSESRMAQSDQAGLGGLMPQAIQSMKRSEGFDICHEGRPDPPLEEQSNLVQGSSDQGAEDSHLSADPAAGVGPRFGSDLETENSWWSWGETEDDSEGSDVNSERDAEPAARVCAILRRNKELVVRQVAGYCRELIGSRQIQVYGCNDGNGKPAAPAAGIPGPGSEAATLDNGGTSKKVQRQAKGKGRRGQDEEDDEGNERRRPNKRQRVLTQDPVAEGLKLACPYFKRNPKGPKISQSCGGPGWNTIHRLKEHLYRRHVCVRCLRCGTSFRTEDELVTHSRAATACTVNCTPTDPDDGFEKHQEALLRRRWKVVNTTEDQWRHLYKILFPDDSDDLTPSPYYHDHRTIVDEFARFELFLRRETSRLLEERLNDSLLGGSASLDPSSLAGQLSNVVNEIQSAAIRAYRRSAQLEPSEGARGPTGVGEGSDGGLNHDTSMSSPSVDILDILEHSTGQQSSSDGAIVGCTEDIESWYDLLVSGDADLVGYDGGQGDLAENDWSFQC